MDFGNLSKMAGQAFNAYEQNQGGQGGQNQGGQGGQNQGGQGGQYQGGQGGQYQGGQGSQQDQGNQQNVPDDIQQGLSHVQNNADNGQYDNASHDDLDHNQLNQANRQAQGNGPVSSQAIGEGAAVQALKSFVGGSGSGSGGGGFGSLMSMAGSFAGGSGGGGGNLAQNPLVMMAMTQAKSMFEQQHAQGNVQGGGSYSSMKQEAINSAGHAAMKMFMGSGSSGGGGFDPSQLMGLASKFA